jgi:hypothetical protein
MKTSIIRAAALPLLATTSAFPAPAIIRPHTDNVIPQWVYTSYVDTVVQQLQTKGHLVAGTAMGPTSVLGNEVKWFTGGRLETEEIDRTMEDASVQDPDRGNLSANFKDYGAMAFVKGVDINNIKPNELNQLGIEGAAAIGRRSDWIQLETMYAAAAATEVETIGDGSEDIDIPDLQQAEGTIMGIGDATVQSMFCALPMFAYQQLCNYKEFNHADYTGPDLAYKSMAPRKTWGFTNYFVLPNEYFMRTEMGGGSIDDDTGFFLAPMWWKGAVGFARRDPPAAPKMQYVVPKRGTFIDNQVGGIAKVLQPDAIKYLKFKWRKPRRFIETVNSIDVTP